jgi:hypothetical protein
MGLQDLLTEAQGGKAPSGGSSKSSSGLQGLLEGATQISERTRQAQREQEAFEFQSKAANSFGSIAKQTLKGAFVDPVVNAYKGTREIQNSFVDKTKANIQQGAREYQQGDPLSLAKAGFRTTADFAEVVFAPLSASIGSILQASGGQKLVDGTGQKIADKSGITDWKRFQEFAIEHPNAGADFNRLLNLATLGAEGNAKINPGTAIPRTAAQITELASKVSREVIRPAPKPTGLRKLELESQAPGQAPQIEAPTRVTPAKVDVELGFRQPDPLPLTGVEAPVAEITPANTSKVARSIQANAVEKGLVTKMDELAVYEPRTVADQASRVATIIDSGDDVIKSIVRGETPLPQGVSGSMFIKGVEEYATLTKNPGLLKDLAASPLVSETSIHASELRLLAERSPESPLTAIKEISEARKTKLGNTDINQAKRQEIVGIKKELNKVKPTRKTWEEFIKSIEC